jgi:3-oxoacyl-[acyl-carrier-protein] synthase II
VSLIDRFDASEFPTKFAAQIKDFSDEGWVYSTSNVILLLN